MEICSNIANILKSIKEKKEYTLTEFADELEISRSQLQGILKGKANPRINTIEHIAKKLNISPEVLITTELNSSQLALAEVLLDFTALLRVVPAEKRAVVIELLIEIFQLLIDDEDDDSE